MPTQVIDATWARSARSEDDVYETARNYGGVTADEVETRTGQRYDAALPRDYTCWQGFAFFDTSGLTAVPAEVYLRAQLIWQGDFATSTIKVRQMADPPPPVYATEWFNWNLGLTCGLIPAGPPETNWSPPGVYSADYDFPLDAADVYAQRGANMMFQIYDSNWLGGIAPTSDVKIQLQIPRLVVVTADLEEGWGITT